MSQIADRYVHAALRTVPQGKREEIGAELRASIADMVEARTENGEPVEEAERAVLTELGNPDALAVQYTGLNQVLIGPRYFLIWWRLLIRLLIIVPGVVATILVILAVVDGEPFGTVVGSLIGDVIGVAMQVAFWTTLAFALIDRYGSDADLPTWSVDQIPDLPARRTVSATETILAIVFYVAVIVLTIVQHFRSWVTDDAGDQVRVLDPDLWSFWLPFLLVVLALSIVLEGVKYAMGDWSFPLATVNAVLGAAFVVPMAWLLTQEMLFSDEFTAAVGMTAEVEGHVGTGLAIGLVLAVAWDAIDGFTKAFRARRREAPGPGAGVAA
ncbi:permease prefix domain 1-containing protein [Aeromicrobium sp. CF4.19]|uniref:permease prefix domain 1-containing protein n=1 Tax=Aeromicrobium sp. CF4.19 TaxID=3373082 RepID=UPI003EE7FFFD